MRDVGLQLDNVFLRLVERLVHALLLQLACALPGEAGPLQVGEIGEAACAGDDGTQPLSPGDGVGTGEDELARQGDIAVGRLSPVGYAPDGQLVERLQLEVVLPACHGLFQIDGYRVGADGITAALNPGEFGVLQVGGELDVARLHEQIA